MRLVPPAERPRERLLAVGVDALSERELLALLLRDGARGVSALELADHLLAEFGGIAGVASARPEELAARRGVGPAKAAAVVAACALGRRSASGAARLPRLRSAADLARLAQVELRGARRERVLVVTCDSANRVRRTDVVTEGAIDRATIPVREILNLVLRHDGRAFAFAHNHPGGDPEPSDADIAATAAVRTAATAVGLRFLGHVVVTDDQWREVT
jgi:DNA repair protein RadC